MSKYVTRITWKPKDKPGKSCPETTSRRVPLKVLWMDPTIWMIVMIIVQSPNKNTPPITIKSSNLSDILAAWQCLLLALKRFPRQFSKKNWWPEGRNQGGNPVGNPGDQVDIKPLAFLNPQPATTLWFWFFTFRIQFGFPRLNRVYRCVRFCTPKFWKVNPVKMLILDILVK